jgi:hypothetical protein
MDMDDGVLGERCRSPALHIAVCAFGHGAEDRAALAAKAAAELVLETRRGAPSL